MCSILFFPLQSFQGKYRHAVEKVVKRRRGELKGSQVYGFKTPKPDGRSAAARRQVKIDERGKGTTNFISCSSVTSRKITIVIFFYVLGTPSTPPHGGRG